MASTLYRPAEMVKPGDVIRWALHGRFDVRPKLGVVDKVQPDNGSGCSLHNGLHANVNVRFDSDDAMLAYMCELQMVYPNG
jgi:hypothetical protein